MANTGFEKSSGGTPATEFDSLIEKAEALSQRTAKLERFADDLLLLAPVAADRAKSNAVALAQNDIADPAWEAAGLPALTIGVRELVIFSALLALGVGAAFFFGYVASKQTPWFFE